MSSATGASLFDNVQTGTDATEEHLNEIVDRYAPLVKRIAHHLLLRMPASVQVDDLIQSGMIGLLEAAKKYALEQSVHEHLTTGINESFHAMLAYIYKKEGNENLAKEHFEKQKNMKYSRTKKIIMNNFSSVRSKVFMNDYIKVLQSLGMPDK